MLEAGVGEFSTLLQSSEVVSVHVGWGVQRLRSSSILPPSACEMVGHGPPLFELWFSYLKSEELDALLPPYFSSVQVLSIVTWTKKKKSSFSTRGEFTGRTLDCHQEEQSRAVQNTPAMAGCGAAFCGVVNAIQLYTATNFWVGQGQTNNRCIK